MLGVFTIATKDLERNNQDGYIKNLQLSISYGLAAYLEQMYYLAKGELKKVQRRKSGAAKVLSFGKLYDILVEMKRNNLGKDFAYSILRDIREDEKERLSKRKYDLILELMDVVSGFCLPSSWIWWT